MKRVYNIPQMRLAYFEDNIHAADASGITKTNGVDITAQAMGNIDRIEKISLDTFSYTF